MLFAKAEVGDREKFAWNIANNLRQMEPDPQRDLWDRWLRKYWENRLEGTPTPLDPTEAGTMLEWLPHLHDLFPEAVDLATNTPNLPPDYTPPIHLLTYKGKPGSHPEATAKLLIYVADQDLPRQGLVWRQGVDRKPH